MVIIVEDEELVASASVSTDTELSFTASLVTIFNAESFGFVFATDSLLEHGAEFTSFVVKMEANFDSAIFDLVDTMVGDFPAEFIADARAVAIVGARDFLAAAIFGVLNTAFTGDSLGGNSPDNASKTLLDAFFPSFVVFFGFVISGTSQGSLFTAIIFLVAITVALGVLVVTGGGIGTSGGLVFDTLVAVVTDVTGITVVVFVTL